LRTSVVATLKDPIMTALRLLSAAALALAAGAAVAGTAPSNPVPEPATWALAGLAAAIGYAVSKRRK